MRSDAEPPYPFPIPSNCFPIFSRENLVCLLGVLSLEPYPTLNIAVGKSCDGVLNHVSAM